MNYFKSLVIQCHHLFNSKLDFHAYVMILQEMSDSVVFHW